MAIKMRVLHWTSKAKIKTIANALKNEFELANNAVDAIPPAYSCDKERLVILCISINDLPSDTLRLFCQELTKVRAANVALMIDGNEKGAEAVKSILKTTGTNFIDDVLFVKGGILPFMSKVKDEELKPILEWAHKVVEQIA